MKKAVYVVTVPQSGTAHQARDKKYHKRRNTTTEAMDDYEIRDVMNRSKFPKIHVGFKFETFPETIGLKIEVSNQGSVIARHVRVFIQMPIILGIKIPEREGLLHTDVKKLTTKYCWKNLHYDFVGKSLSSEAKNSAWAGTRSTEDCFITRDSPILPQTNLTSTYALGLTPKSIDQIVDKEITWDAYADNAPVRSGKLELSELAKELREHYSIKQ